MDNNAIALTGELDQLLEALDHGDTTNARIVLAMVARYGDLDLLRFVFRAIQREHEREEA